ncbi:hypothetical protein EJ377_18005 [Chryseobacterium arthrosphaerae]|uniref:Uncharacterized protein n=1 Tax=Chryseobacterium arthrosphaerae TaxID=651561 RepID=A0A432DT09_9FLAO|nr:hypothetical protein EJ377_18005 [Chryseobacterium arthrosphaerae]
MEKELIKLGFREQITKEEIFDDAFEFMLKLNKEEPNENSSHPASSGEIDIEALKRKLSCWIHHRKWELNSFHPERLW